MATDTRRLSVVREWERRRGGVAVGRWGSSMQQPSIARRLGLRLELFGHDGCINCIRWNNDGAAAVCLSPLCLSLSDSLPLSPSLSLALTHTLSHGWDSMFIITRLCPQELGLPQQVMIAT